MVAHLVPSGAPQSLEATFLQPSEVSLNWREVPCIQQNGPITGYVVRYYATCGPDRDVQQTKSVVTTGSNIDGLTPNTEYAFQVAAVNTNGTGPFSEASTLGGSYTLPIVKLLFSYVGAPQLVIQMINASLLYKQEFHIQ